MRPRSVGLFVGCGTGLLVLLSPPVRGSLSEGEQVPRVENEIRVDGHLDEAFWTEALAIPLPFEIDPGDNQPAVVATACYLAYDASRLLFGCRASDPDPAGIRARFRERDRLEDDDRIGLTLDTFDDGRRAFEFWVNPLGVQHDLFRNDSGTGEEENHAWDALWDAAGRIDSEGFTVEAAIPFSSLRFQRTSEDQNWRIMVRRNWPRATEHTLSSVPIDRARDCLLCQAVRVGGFESREPGHDLEVIPALTAFRADRPSRDEQGSLDSEMGITALWGVTPNISLAATLNPDFSQVEADAARLDVNRRFALFFPERRPFFLEDADLFESFFDVVHTRTVADPTWGLRTTGKQGGHAFGFFTARDERTEILLPGPESSDAVFLDRESQASVLRYRRDLGERSTLGAIVSDRRARDYSNRVAGLDGRFRLNPSDSVSFQVLGSQSRFSEELGTDLGSGVDLQGLAVRADLKRRSRDWDWTLRYQRIGREFRADLGFMPRVGLADYEVEVQRTWWEPSERWNRVELGAQWGRTENLEGELLDGALELRLKLRGPWQSELSYQPELSETTFGGISFESLRHQIEVSLVPSAILETGVEIGWGDAIDFGQGRKGNSIEVEPWIVLNAGRRLQVEGAFTTERFDLESGRLFEAFQSDILTRIHFNARSFARLTLQHTDLRRDQDLVGRPVPSQQQELLGQLLVSYRFSAKTNVFLGLSEERHQIENRSWEVDERTVFFKVAYAWTP